MASVTLGYEKQLYEMADKLRNKIEESEYKHVVLGLIFLKYITDSFNERYEEVKSEYPGLEEDRDSYTSVNVFFVPREARWDYIKKNAKQPTIGNIIDNAMVLIEKENPTLKNVLPKNYGRAELDKIMLGELVDLFSFNVGGKEAKAKDVLGRVYEYFQQLNNDAILHYLLQFNTFFHKGPELHLAIRSGVTLVEFLISKLNEQRRML